MLRELLAQRQTAIWEEWRQRIFSSYPEKSAKFFAHQKDRFANPVGQTISDATKLVVEALIKDALESDDQVPIHLERMIRIRSVQEFSPSEAVSFVYCLRDALRKQLRADLERSAELRAELRQLEDGPLTQLVLQSFEIYVTCRERLYNVRVNELKRSVYSMRRRFANPEIEDPFLASQGTGEPGAGEVGAGEVGAGEAGAEEGDEGESH